MNSFCGIRQLCQKYGFYELSSIDNPQNNQEYQNQIKEGPVSSYIADNHNFINSIKNQNFSYNYESSESYSHRKMEVESDLAQEKKLNSSVGLIKIKQEIPNINSENHIMNILNEQEVIENSNEELLDSPLLKGIDDLNEDLSDLDIQLSLSIENIFFKNEDNYIEKNDKKIIQLTECEDECNVQVTDEDVNLDQDSFIDFDQIHKEFYQKFSQNININEIIYIIKLQNSIGGVRKSIEEFKQKRRSIQQDNYKQYKEIFLDYQNQIEHKQEYNLIKILQYLQIQKEDYQSAYDLYQYLLTDIDLASGLFERFQMPNNFNNQSASNILNEIEKFILKQWNFYSELELNMTSEQLLKIIRYKAEDFIHLKHGVEIEQIYKVIYNNQQFMYMNYESQNSINKKINTPKQKNLNMFTIREDEDEENISEDSDNSFHHKFIQF